MARPLPLLALAAALLAGCSRSDPTAAPATDTAAAPSAPAATTGDFDTGKQVYNRVCFVCHQPTGIGVPGAFPPLAGSEIVAGDPARLVRIVLHGLQGPLTVHGATFNSVMPAQGPLLKDQEIADALTYVRAAWGNRADPVPVDLVKTIRATVKRDTPWTWPELNAP